MNDKQNVIFFLALTLLLVSFTLSGRTKILWDGIFNQFPNISKSSGKTGNAGLPKNYKPKEPKNCKQGYTWNPLFGVCVPNNFPVK